MQETTAIYKCGEAGRTEESGERVHSLKMKMRKIKGGRDSLK